MATLKSKIKETAGHIEEELGEAVGNDDVAEKVRKLRNEGRVAACKAPKVAPIGSEKP